MIKNIIFDIGNVLLNFNPSIYLKNRYSEKETAFLLSAIFESKEWLELDRGTITEEKALKLIIDRAPDKEVLLRDQMADFHNIFTPILSTVSLLKPLSDQGYSLFYLSNIHLKIYKFILNKYDLFNFFKGGIISSEVIMMKPDDEIYQSLLNKYSIKSEESIFIDDTRENILAAERMGFQSIHFTAPETLIERLSEFGVDPVVTL